MVLHSAIIDNFKNIKHIEIASNGHHITLAGTNGTGKSAVVQAVLSCLLGKKVLPNDPIMHGKESAKIELNISDVPGGKIQYTVSVKITEKTFSINVHTYNQQGHKLTVQKPVSFLESIITRDFIDPLNFVNRPGKERIAMLYSIVPGLQEEIDALNEDRISIQTKRSLSANEKGRIEYELAQHPYTEGLQEEEIDPSSILVKLQDAESHNLSKTGIENSIKSAEHDIAISVEMRENVERNIAYLRSELAKKEKEFEDLKKQIPVLEKVKADREKQLEEFKPVDVESIRQEMAELNNTNKKIRDNIVHTLLLNDLESEREQFSEGLKKMKEIDQKKVAVYQKYNMPVENMVVGDNDIMYPDPKTSEVVNFGNLSTGQQYQVAVRILSAFLPKPEEGLRCMFIQNVNDLDETNYKIMLESANENDIELILHKTLYQSESNVCEIIIEER